MVDKNEHERIPLCSDVPTVTPVPINNPIDMKIERELYQTLLEDYQVP